jgi:hypothetical protein
VKKIISFFGKEELVFETKSTYLDAGVITKTFTLPRWFLILLGVIIYGCIIYGFVVVITR